MNKLYVHVQWNLLAVRQIVDRNVLSVLNARPIEPVIIEDASIHVLDLVVSTLIAM